MVYYIKTSYVLRRWTNNVIYVYELLYQLVKLDSEDSRFRVEMEENWCDGGDQVYLQLCITQ